MNKKIIFLFISFSKLSSLEKSLKEFEPWVNEEKIYFNEKQKHNFVSFFVNLFVLCLQNNKYIEKKNLYI